MVITKKDKEKLHEGDICPECKRGRIALMTNLVGYANKDQEPYKSGCLQGDSEEISLSDNIIVVINACDDCGEIIRRWFDDDYSGLRK